MNTHILFIISLLSKEVAAIDCSQCTFPDSQDPDDVTCITSPPAATACLPNATRCEAAVSASMRGGALPIVLSFRRRCSAVQGNQGCAQAQNTQECQTTCGTGQFSFSKISLFVSFPTSFHNTNCPIP
ncbi:Hypp1414 [Branchiostoma lanceolatum]|uniref:Hypp1414 protein n=1 Tax=Branchiostoma lanceolatum TaxID=7740 RepID=A0A8K0ENM9_BRALA|nr:Hypp1414 [Branchiostoma lanceolatum]